jgi:hypothetical protein
MNDLNEKLWSDAVESYIDSTANDDIDLTDPYVVREIRKKFAELIVRECAEIAADQSAIRPEYRIRKHFGVEE